MKVHRRWNTLSPVSLSLGLSISGAIGASAATLYQDNNYSNEMGSWKNQDLPDWANDRASSIVRNGSWLICENLGCSGRNAPLNGDYNDLSALTTNLHFGETWNDRITAVR